jgi:hypothetical protein
MIKIPAGKARTGGVRLATTRVLRALSASLSQSTSSPLHCGSMLLAQVQHAQGTYATALLACLARAEQVAEEICELRWASISELYRSEMLGEKEILLPEVIR